MEKLEKLKEILAAEQDKAFSLFKKNRKQYNNTYGSWCFESVLWMGYGCDRHTHGGGRI